MLQCRQEKDGWKTVSGMRLATTVQITRTAPDNINVTIGISEWSDKIGAGVAGMLLFWPLAVTAGIGAYKQKKLPEEIFRCIENYLISSTRPGQAPQQTSSVNTCLLYTSKTKNPDNSDNNGYCFSSNKNHPCRHIKFLLSTATYKELLTICTVSYTHLDVYKRQTYFYNVSRSPPDKYPR